MGISLTGRGLLDSTLPFLGSAGWRWRKGRSRGHLTMALGWLLLRGLPSARHKTNNCHGLSSHHVFVMVKFGFRVNKFYSYLLGFLNESLGFNRDLGWDEGFLNESLGLNRRVS